MLKRFQPVVPFSRVGFFDKEQKTESFGTAPRLSYAAARNMGLIAVEDLGNTAHAGLLEVLLRTVQEAKALHGAAAHADDGLLALQGLEVLQSALAEVDVPGQSKACHRKIW